MTISRREALILSSSTLAGLSLRMVTPERLVALAQDPQDWPTTLVEEPLREGFPAPLPLNPDGSAPEHPESAAGPIQGQLMWRTADRTTPPGEYDYRNMAIRVDTRGFARLAPDLAVEIVSPSNTHSEIHDKVSDYLDAGSRLVWVVEPHGRTVTVYRSRDDIRILTSEQEIDGGEVLPGFRAPVSEFFAG